MPLTELKYGERGRIKSIRVSPGGGRRRGTRGWGLKRRLMDLGLTPGVEVTVVNSTPFKGPLEVIVRGSRLALGRGMANRIFVEVER